MIKTCGKLLNKLPFQGNFVGISRKIPGNFPVVVTGNNREDLAVGERVGESFVLLITSTGGAGGRFSTIKENAIF